MHRNTGKNRTEKTKKSLSKWLFRYRCQLLGILFAITVGFISVNRILNTMDSILEYSIKDHVAQIAQAHAHELIDHGLSLNTPECKPKINTNPDIADQHTRDKEDLQNIIKAEIVTMSKDRDLLSTLYKTLLLARSLDEIQELLAEEGHGLNIEELINEILPSIVKGVIVEQHMAYRQFLITIDNIQYTLLNIHQEYNDYLPVDFKSPNIVQELISFRLLQAKSTESLTWYLTRRYNDLVRYAIGTDYTIDEMSIILRDLITALLHASKMGYCFNRNRINLMAVERDENNEVKSVKLMQNHFEKINICNFECENAALDMIVEIINCWAETGNRKESPPRKKMNHLANDRTKNIYSDVNPLLVDLAFICSGYTKYPPKTLESLMEHSLLKGTPLDTQNDVFGPRLYVSY